MICPKCGSRFTYIKPDSNTYGCKACEAEAEKEYEAKRRKYIKDNPSNEDLIAWENENKPNVKETFSFGRVVGTDGQCPLCHSTSIVEKVYRRKKQDQVKTCSGDGNDIIGEKLEYRFKHNNFTYQLIEDEIILFPYNLIFPLRQIAEFYKVRNVLSKK